MSTSQPQYTPKVNDVVLSPVMRVEHIDGDKASCIFVDDAGATHRIVADLADLKLAEERDAQR